MEGVYVRPNGVATFYHGTVEASSPNCFKKISEIEKDKVLYQKITTDQTGYPTKIEFVQLAACDSSAINTPWKYNASCASTQCGVIWHRMSKTVEDCRISPTNPKKHLKYTTIKTNDFFIPPLVMNVDEGGLGENLVKPMVGNTIPIKSLYGKDGTDVSDCGNYLEVKSGVAFIGQPKASCDPNAPAPQPPSKPIMNDPLCLSWCNGDGSKFGFKIAPNQADYPFIFTVSTHGKPNGSSYEAGCGIDPCRLKCNEICVYLAHKGEGDCDKSRAGIIKDIIVSTDSINELKSPTLKQGVITLPDYGKLTSYKGGCGICVNCQTKFINLLPSNGGTIGGITSVVISDSVSNPCISNGIITLPKGQGGSCAYHAGQGLCLSNNCFNLLPSNGGRIGGIISVSIDSTITSPTITNGEIKIPKGEGGSCAYRAGQGLCLSNNCFNLKPSNNGSIGGIISVTLDSTITSPSISNGEIKIPKAQGGGTDYDFSCWFIVSGNSVNLNEAKLTEIANSLASCVSSSITSTATATLGYYNNKGSCGEIVATINTNCGTSASAGVAARGF